MSKNAYADGGVRGSGSDNPMGGLVMRWCACDDCDSGVDAGTVDVDVDIVVAYSRAMSEQYSM